MSAPQVRLAEVLNDDEISSTPSNVRVKLEALLESKNMQLESIRHQLTSAHADTEKANFDLERELQQTKLKLQMSEEFSDKIKKQLKEVEDSLQKSRRDLFEAMHGMFRQ